MGLKDKQKCHVTLVWKKTKSVMLHGFWKKNKSVAFHGFERKTKVSCYMALKGSYRIPGFERACEVAQLQ